MKAKTKEEEERGVKGSIDDWEEFAKKLEATAEKKAEESKNLGEGMDADSLDVGRKNGAASLGESDVKCDEAVLELINSTWKECQVELCYNAISDELMDEELVEAARALEVEKFQKNGAHEKAPIEER